MSVSTPNWVKDAIFYQIFPDRFARDEHDHSAGPAGMSVRFQPWASPPTPYGFQGGNLAGIEQRLDYLSALGINAIYLNPIFASAANHRYIAHDFFQIDPLLGGDAAFERFLTAAHDHNMRVVLDGVFNHCSRGFFQFHHILETGPDSPYLDWFHIHGWPLNPYSAEGPLNYSAWWSIGSLPKFNTNTPAVREFLWSVGTYWLEKGIDGWRLDVPDEIDDDEFWREFRRRCKAVNPDAYIVAELWKPARRWLQGDQFDAQMNYLFTRAILGYCVGRQLDQSLTTPMGYGRIKARSGKSFAEELNTIFNKMYHPEIAFVQLNMLGSHDTPRLMTLANEDAATVKLAFLCQMTVPGAPNIYYGDEIGMTGGRDPECRATFPWDEESGWNLPLREEIQRLVALRHRLAALRRGAFEVIYADKALAVYERRYGDERVVVGLNGTNKDATFVVPASVDPDLGEEPVGLAAGERLRAGDKVIIPAKSGRVWSSEVA
jgi:neopullulanase